MHSDFSDFFVQANINQRLCYTPDKLKRKTNDDDLFSPHVGIFPKGENYTIHQRVKAFLFKTPLKCILFCPRYIIEEKRREHFLKSSIICSPNSKDWSVKEASVTKLAPPPQSRQRKHRSLLNTMKNKGGNVPACEILCAHYAMTYQIPTVED